MCSSELDLNFYKPYLESYVQHRINYPNRFRKMYSLQTLAAKAASLQNHHGQISNTLLPLIMKNQKPRVYVGPYFGSIDISRNGYTVKRKPNDKNYIYEWDFDLTSKERYLSKNTPLNPWKFRK